MVSRLRVINVTDGFSAAEAGIKKGDVLEKYNEVELINDAALTYAAQTATGNSIALVIASPNGPIEKVLPKGRLGIDVIAIDFDQDNYFKEIEIDRKINEIIVTTTQNIDGFRIREYKDIVTAEAVCGVGLITEFFASFSDTLGGRNKSLQRTLAVAKIDCISELKKEALRLGANAIVGIDLDYSEFSGQGKSMLFLVASGTAVCIEPIPK